MKTVVDVRWKYFFIFCSVWCSWCVATDSSGWCVAGCDVFLMALLSTKHQSASIKKHQIRTIRRDEVCGNWSRINLKFCWSILFSIHMKFYDRTYVEICTHWRQQRNFKELRGEVWEYSHTYRRRAAHECKIFWSLKVIPAANFCGEKLAVRVALSIQILASAIIHTYAYAQ